eukprot:scaffold215186_cov72-Attheya_sp.AAC.1
MSSIWYSPESIFARTLLPSGVAMSDIRTVDPREIHVRQWGCVFKRTFRDSGMQLVVSYRYDELLSQGSVGANMS